MSKRPCSKKECATLSLVTQSMTSKISSTWKLQYLCKKLTRSTSERSIKWRGSIQLERHIISKCTRRTSCSTKNPSKTSHGSASTTPTQKTARLFTKKNSKKRGKAGLLERHSTSSNQWTLICRMNDQWTNSMSRPYSAKTRMLTI